MHLYIHVVYIHVIESTVSLIFLMFVCVCLKVTTVPSAQSFRLLDFSFSDFDLSDTETTLATIRMFVDLNLVQNFQMKYTVRADLGCY